MEVRPIKLRSRNPHHQPNYSSNRFSTHKIQDLDNILEFYNKPIKNTTKKVALQLPFYKGVQLPSHLKWVTLSSKVSEDMLVQEVRSLQNEIARLRQLKIANREFRKSAHMPIGVLSKPCQCCKKWQRKHHNCSHKYCSKPCKKQSDFVQKLKKRAEKKLQFLNLNEKNYGTSEIIENQIKVIMDEVDFFLKEGFIDTVPVIHPAVPSHMQNPFIYHQKYPNDFQSLQSNGIKDNQNMQNTFNQSNNSSAYKSLLYSTKLNNERFCTCCGSYTNRHRCPHTLCQKPCKLQISQTRRIERYEAEKKGIDVGEYRKKLYDNPNNMSQDEQEVPPQNNPEEHIPNPELIEDQKIEENSFAEYEFPPEDIPDEPIESKMKKIFQMPELDFSGAESSGDEGLSQISDMSNLSYLDVSKKKKKEKDKKLKKGKNGKIPIEFYESYQNSKKSKKRTSRPRRSYKGFEIQFTFSNQSVTVKI